MIKQINSNQQKTKITEQILRQLPEWFGIEESLLEYIENVKEKIFYTAYENNRAIGFICIEFHNDFTADIHVMGILKEYHRKGIGKELVRVVENYLIENGYRFLMVKTLGESSKDKNYAKTRKFYRNVGFYPLEEFKEIWDEHNPCLIMIKNLM